MKNEHKEQLKQFITSAYNLGRWKIIRDVEIVPLEDLQDSLLSFVENEVVGGMKKDLISKFSRLDIELVVLEETATQLVDEGARILKEKNRITEAMYDFLGIRKEENLSESLHNGE